MAIRTHSSEFNRKAGVVGGIRFGSDTGILAAGDLTSAAAAKAAVDADVAKLHSAEKLFGYRVKAAIDAADDYLAGATTDSSINNITALLPSVRGRSLRL